MIKINNLLKIFNKNKSNEVRAINDVSVEFPETRQIRRRRDNHGRKRLQKVRGR